MFPVYKKKDSESCASQRGSDPVFLESLFIKAHNLEQLGRTKQIITLYKMAALRGHISSIFSLGYSFDVGLNVRKNRKKAMFWYKMAARKGSPIACSNIGIIYRDEENFKLARLWFLKAVKKGDGDAALELAKLFLKQKRGMKQAKKYLCIALKSKSITEVSKEEAANLLNEIKI